MREREKSGVEGKRYFIISHAQIRRGDPADPAAAQHIHEVDDKLKVALLSCPALAPPSTLVCGDGGDLCVCGGSAADAAAPGGGGASGPSGMWRRGARRGRRATK